MRKVRDAKSKTKEAEVASWWDKTPDALKWIAAVMGGLTAVLTAIGPLSQQVGPAVTFIKSAFVSPTPPGPAISSGRNCRQETRFDATQYTPRSEVVTVCD